MQMTHLELPPLLLSLRALQISCKNERDPADSQTEERPRRQKTRHKRPQVYNEWEMNDMDDSSWGVRRMATAKERDDEFTQDALEVELSCKAFVNLATSVRVFKNARGEPNDWQLQDGGRHKAFSKNFKVDQPWMKAEWSKRDDAWQIVEHEGRHRGAWTCNRLNIPNLTIMLGFTWPPILAGEYGQPQPGDIVLEQLTPEGEEPVRARLEKNDRPGGVAWRLVLVE